jgi:hypothetical protein
MPLLSPNELHLRVSQGYGSLKFSFPSEEYRNELSSTELEALKYIISHQFNKRFFDDSTGSNKMVRYPVIQYIMRISNSE